MKSRTSDTCILLAGRNRIARADFARGELVALARDEDAVADGVPAQVQAAAGLGGHLPRTVWVLAEDVFTHEFKLRAQLLDGLSPEQTARMLGYEASAISGLTASESVLAFQLAPASPLERAFLVVQLARADQSAIESLLAERGARLGGIAHPCAVPRALAPDAAGPWRRVEAWPDLLVDVERAGGAVVARLRRTDPTRRTRDLPGEAPITETLDSGGGLALDAPPLARGFDLSVEEDLHAWLAAWGRALHEDAARVVALRPAPRTASVRTRALYAIGAAALAAAAAGIHWAGLVERRDAMRAELSSLRAPAERVAKLRADAARLQGEVETLEAQAATMRAALTRAGWSADAPVRLLEAAAAGRPAGLSIDALDVGWSGVRVRGLALRPDLVDRLGLSLSTALAPEGFVVAPADRKRRELDSGDELYEYVLDVRPGPGAAAQPVVER